MSFQNIRKGLLAGAILLFSLNAQAQIEKGATTLGGSANFNAAKGWNSLSASTFTNHDFHKSAYVGVNKFLNRDIAIEGTLGVNHSNLMLNPQLATNSIYGSTNVYTTGLNFSINSFTHFKSSESDLEGLVSKGRTVIGGNLSIISLSVQMLVCAFY